MLERAMLIHLIYPSTSTQIPITADRKKSPVLQFINTGLLNYFVGLQLHFFRYENLHAFYRSLVAEHIVRQELMALNMLYNRKFCSGSEKKNSPQQRLIFYCHFGIMLSLSR
ncbi:MAG: hypothetical protein ACE5HI_13530 [bacterium]